MVDEASERKPATSSYANSANKHFATRSIVQKRLSIYNWNPGPWREKKDAFDILTSRFHLTHYAFCAVLLNKDTFYSDIDVKSIYLHDTRRDLSDQVMEGDQGWVMQGVLSRASFRRSPVSGQKYFTVLSLHMSNIYVKKKGIAKKLILTLPAIMISQEVDLVAGDFNGITWRHRGRDNFSTIDEDSILPTPPGPPPLWGPARIHSGQLGRRLWISQTAWLSAILVSIPRKTLGLRPTDQSCHQETWLHLDIVD